VSIPRKRIGDSLVLPNCWIKILKRNLSVDIPAFANFRMRMKGEAGVRVVCGVGLGGGEIRS
jgi:hypothetical protein